MDSQNTHTLSPYPGVKPVLVIAGVVLVTLLAGDALLGTLREGARQEAKRNISAVGTLKSNQMHDWLDDRLADAGTLSDNSYFAREAVRWMDGGARDPLVRKQLVGRLEAFLNGHHFRSIVLYDESGCAMLSAGMPIPEEDGMKEVARQVTLSGLPGLIDLHRYPDASLPAGLGFMNPLRKGKAFYGAIYLAKDPARYLFPMISQWPSASETAETLLVRVEGADIKYLSRLRHGDDAKADLSLPLTTPRLDAAAAGGEPGLLESRRDYRGKPVLAYAAAIKGTPWWLISKIDEEEAYRVVDQVRREAGVLAMFIFILMGAGFWQWRSRKQAAVEAAVLQERVRDENGVPEYFISALQDITDRKQLERALEDNLSILRMALEGAQGAVWEWDLVSGKAKLSPQYYTMLGYEPDEFPANRDEWLARIHPDECDGVIGKIRDELAVNQDMYIAEYRMRAKDGRYRWIQGRGKCIAFDATGKPTRMVGINADITERKQSEQQISFMAYHDKLTGLPNRAAVRPSGAGHVAGQGCRREDRADIRAQPVPVGRQRVHRVGASVGISIYPDHGNAMDSLLTAADRAMYESKRHGKNTHTFFSESAVREDEPWIKFDAGHLAGIEEIDGQHRNLVYLASRLNEALKHGESKETTLLMFDELLVATTHHFDTESRCMTQYHYPEQVAHEEEHAHLVDEALQMKGQFRDGREQLALQSIKDWLLGHILYSDKKMTACLRQQGMI